MEQESLRPFVQVAAICQTALQESAGFLSLIRLIDRVPVAGVTDEMQPQPLNNLVLVIVLKSGSMRGKFNVSIVPETPSGKRLPGPSLGVLFEGEERGVAAILPVGIVAEEEGLYWFDIMLEQDVLTRVPLRVMYQKMQPGIPFQQPQVG
jgi:hypothetical protein